jgi:long-chain acyl-CoA synthetase
MWLPNGCLKIIDRIKHIFKLSQGEYISPEKIENIYSRSLFAAQIFVEGNSLKGNYKFLSNRSNKKKIVHYKH